MKVSTQVFRPINFVNLADQTGSILHSPPTPTQDGSSSSTLVMTTSLIAGKLNKIMPSLHGVQYMYSTVSPLLLVGFQDCH